MQRQMCTQFVQTFNFLISVQVFILIPKSRWWNVLDKAPPILTPHSWITVLCSLKKIGNFTKLYIASTAQSIWGSRIDTKNPKFPFKAYGQWHGSINVSGFQQKNTEVRGTREATSYEICSDFIMTVKLKQLYYVMHKWLTL